MKISCDGAPTGCIGSLIRLKQKYPYLKVVLSIGGGGPASQNFAGVAASGAARDNFGRSARGLLDASGLDGIDSSYLFRCFTLYANTCKSTGNIHPMTNKVETSLSY